MENLIRFKRIHQSRFDANPHQPYDEIWLFARFSPCLLVSVVRCNLTMRIAYLECFSGISGDMFLGALLDCGVPAELFTRTVEALGVEARLEISRVQRSGISAVKLDVMIAGEKELPREEFWEKREHLHQQHQHQHQHEDGHEHSLGQAHGGREHDHEHAHGDHEQDHEHSHGNLHHDHQHGHEHSAHERDHEHSEHSQHR